MQKLRFLGIDPGLQKTGWGILDMNVDSSFTYIASGIIKTKSIDVLPKRLHFIFSEVSATIKKFLPDHSAIEDTYVNDNYKSSLKLSQARAAAIVAMSNCNLIPDEYPAKTIKKTLVGSGRADKKQIIGMLKFFIPTAVNLTEDAADALALAICHANHHKIKYTNRHTS